MSHIPILITGAGPTGLVLALWLTKIGIKVRIIDKAEEKVTTSRALVIHARTLEFYRQLGIADHIVEMGFRFPALNLWVNQVRTAQVSIADIGKGVSPFSYIIILPQDQHEMILIKELEALGVSIERNTELIDLEQNEQKVTAQIRLSNNDVETISADFLAGCDGARSIVREKINAGFEGSTYPHLFYVADVAGRGPVINGELHVSLDKSEFMAFFPLKQPGHARLIGVIRDENKTPTWDDVNPRLLQEMNVTITNVNWFSTYHVHHRVASHFQKGRVFLLGDAGHIHSPLGGQGMNTGIGDAVNLAWKLGEVLNKKSDLSLLTTYEAERIGFARQLVQTTDRAFRFISNDGPVAQTVRTKIVPIIFPWIFKLQIARHFLFQSLSQTGITYRKHFIKSAQKLQPGDRLPWIESVDNFKPLQSLDWQIHVYGDRAVKAKYEVHYFSWNKEMQDKGLQKNIAYLIRPDGHLGFFT
ncbi:FAD-dependent oxidoreductase [Bdellovibrio sp. qaytius]|nr:FAD-dependent oxidoreductase [Bdellovibrio sp. qaytius]